MDSSLSQIGYAIESAWKIPPSPLTFQTLRFNSETLKIGRDKVQSQEIRNDRNVADLIAVGNNAGGGTEHELSYATFDDIIQAVMFGAWNANVITNGTALTSFHMLKKETGQQSQTIYELFKGMVINSISIKITKKAVMMISISYLGANGEETLVAPGTFVAANTNPVFDATNAFLVNEAIVSPAPFISEMTLDLNNNCTVDDACGEIEAIGIVSGQFVASGSLSLYFRNINLLTAYLDNLDGPLEITLGNTTNQKYTIELPKVKFGDFSHPTAGNSQSVIATAPFTAIYDSVAGYAAKITRAVA
jgi:hypothetical protein